MVRLIEQHKAFDLLRPECDRGFLRQRSRSDEVRVILHFIHQPQQVHPIKDIAAVLEIERDLNALPRGNKDRQLRSPARSVQAYSFVGSSGLGYRPVPGGSPTLTGSPICNETRNCPWSPP